MKTALCIKNFESSCRDYGVVAFYENHFYSVLKCDGETIRIQDHYNYYPATFSLTPELNKIAFDFYEYFTIDIKEIRKRKLLQLEKI